MMKRKDSEDRDDAAVEAEADPESTSTGADSESPSQAAAGDADSALARELAELRDRYQRTLAEAENTRKRHQREMQDARQYAIADFAKDLLEVVDNLSRAIDGAPAEEADSPVLSGVKLVHDQLQKALANHGVTKVDADRVPFDPMVHNAVMEEPRDDVPSGTVTEELVRGYVLNDRLLRAAMVKVSRAGSGGSEAKGGAAPSGQE